MRAFEQIASCYSTCCMYNLALTYLKKALMVAYEMNDTMSELKYYEKLGIASMNAGDTQKMLAYQNRVMYGQLEPKSSGTR
jgi:hypothetical protein